MQRKSVFSTSATRRTLLTGAAGVAAATILKYPANAAEFNFKLGHDNPATHPVNIRAVEAAEKIGKDSSGRIEVKVFPNNQLGNDTQMISQLRSGALEFLLIGDNILANVVPACNLAGLPFAYKGYPDLWTTLDGPFGKYLKGQIEKTGLHAFEKGWDVGMRHVFTTSRPVNNVADMKGLKLRVPEAPIQLATFRALGSSPTPINNSELYTALQTHLIDGAEQPLISIEVARYYEISKYISLTNHQPTCWELVANGTAWRRLPKDLQDLVAKNFDETALRERQDMANGEKDLEEKLKTQGQQIIQPDIESFKKTIADSGLYKKWRDDYGTEGFDLLEKAVGKLA